MRTFSRKTCKRVFHNENVNKSACFPSRVVILTRRSKEESPACTRDPSQKLRMTGGCFLRTFPEKRVNGCSRKRLVAPRRRREGVYNRTAKASVTFCGEAARRSGERWIPQNPPRVKRSPRRRARRSRQTALSEESAVHIVEYMTTSRRRMIRIPAADSRRRFGAARRWAASPRGRRAWRRLPRRLFGAAPRFGRESFARSRCTAPDCP